MCKECRVCSNTKPLEDFIKSKRRLDGYDTICKACNRYIVNNRNASVEYKNESS